MFQIHSTEARSILSATSGFIAQAGFTHSLTPARNCTYGCSYCYVPTLGIYGGLRPEDAGKWGQETTYKSNAASLLARALRPEQVIYCSPMVDPYQPAEESMVAMPGILEAVIRHPPRVFVLQTRGPLILRDLDQLRRLSQRTTLRVSFSVTTDRDEIRRIYEPRCASIEERFATVSSLRNSGICVHVTLAPLLPCDPERLVHLAIQSTREDVIADPLHVRALKSRGATTRDAAAKISAHYGFMEWHNAEFQQSVVARMESAAASAGRQLATGTRGFSWLAKAGECRYSNG